MRLSGMTRIEVVRATASGVLTYSSCPATVVRTGTGAYTVTFPANFHVLGVSGSMYQSGAGYLVIVSIAASVVTVNMINSVGSANDLAFTITAVGF